MGTRGRKGSIEAMTRPLRVVAPPRPVELPAPPEHLSATMQAWWREAVAEYDFDAHHLLLLEAAADAWDTMVNARDTARREGLTVQGANGPKPHPVVAIERDARLAFARLIRELDLDCEPPREQHGWRPPAIRSNRRR